MKMLAMLGPPSLKGCGQCGVITAVLSDPLSLLMRKIVRQDHCAVGFYHTANMYGHPQCYVTLFNCFDTNTVPWLAGGYTLERFMASPFVDSVSFHPYRGEDSEVHFVTAILRAIANNKRCSSEVSYRRILLDMVGLPQSGRETGYDLVNQVIYSLMPSKQTTEQRIIQTSLLAGPYTLTASSSEPEGEEEVLAIVHKEVIKVSSVFVDLFINSQEFRERIFTVSPAPVPEEKNPLIDELLEEEVQYSVYVASALETGKFNHLTEVINRLEAVREKLGAKERLRVPKKGVELEELGQAIAKAKGRGTLAALYNRIPGVTQITAPNSNVGTMTYHELKEAMVYLDGLAQTDSQHIALQNCIGRELALRSRPK